MPFSSNSNEVIVMLGHYGGRNPELLRQSNGEFNVTGNSWLTTEELLVKMRIPDRCQNEGYLMVD